MSIDPLYNIDGFRPPQQLPPRSALSERIQEQLNRTRADCAGKLEALIERYDAGSRSIEELLARVLPAR